MNLALLATLKEKLQIAKDFKDIWSYFFDQFGDHPEFLDLGETVQDPFLVALVEQAGRGIFGKMVKLDHSFFVRLPEYHFLHGALSLGGRLANVLYFEDIKVGSLSVIMSPTSSQTHFVRFSAEILPQNWSPSNN